MPMTLQHTKITEGDKHLAVELLIANSPDHDEASEMLHIRFRTEKDRSLWHLAAIQREVLERIQTVVAAEIEAARQRLVQAPKR